MSVTCHYSIFECMVTIIQKIFLSHRNILCRPRFVVLFKSITRKTSITLPFQMALQPGVGLGLLYNMPPSLSIPCSVSPFVYTHLSQVHGHVNQPSHFWSSSSSCCVQLSAHVFWECGVLHSFYITKPSYSLTFNKPDNALPLDYGF